jgi:methylated-DNA-[protein]-cysteine S-methyltransferase
VAADLSARDGSGAATWLATTVPTPLGPLVAVASDRGVVAADLDVDERRYLAQLEARFDVAIRRDDRAMAHVRTDARAYFGRRPRPLAEPVDLATAATPFMRRVYEATIAVPFGELRTYGDVAAAAGSPRAWRAAGHALRHCPVELWIPCHRVVPAGPGLGSYGGRPEVRASLLRIEGSLPDRSPGGRSAVRTGR